MECITSVTKVAASVCTQLHLLKAGTAALGCCLVVFFFVKPVAAWISMRNVSLGKQQLPPGSMGLLWLGETLSFLSSLRQGGPSKFMRERTAKFGSLIFKTNLFLSPMVVMQGAEANRFLSNGESRQELRNAWPAFTLELVGWNVPPAVHGAQHKRQRQIMNACLGPAALQKVVGRADSMTKKHVEAWWKDGERLSVVSSVRTHAFEVAYSLLVGREEQQHVLSSMETLFRTWTTGLASLPVDLPGTKYRKAKRARDELRQQIDRVIQQRQHQLRQANDELAGEDLHELAGEDLLSQFLQARDENGSALSQEELRNVTLLLLFAGYDTVTATLTFALKFIEENPSCLDRLVEEHHQIACQKNPGDPISWVDVSNMKYTWAVLQETMRLRAPALGGVRETLTDLQYNGYTIPKGWKILFTMSATHEDGQYFKDPSKFDPSRFEFDRMQKEGPTPLSYVPFGFGPHACKGTYFARMTMSLYIHHLIISKRRWISLEPDEKYHCIPMLTFSKGFPILVSRD